MTIPVRNLYYLLTYACDVLDEGEHVNVQLHDVHDARDLLARILITAASRQLRRGLSRRYITLREERPGVRGKLVLAESIKRQSFLRARAVCEVDELSHDVKVNQIL